MSNTTTARKTTRTASKATAKKATASKATAKKATAKKATAKKATAKKVVTAADANLPAGAIYKVLTAPAFASERIGELCEEYGVAQVNGRKARRTRREMARDLAKAMVERREVPSDVVERVAAKKAPAKKAAAKRAGWPEKGPKVSLNALADWTAENASLWTGKTAASTPRDLRHLVANAEAGRVKLPANLATLSEEDLVALRSATLHGRGDLPLAPACVRGIVASLRRAYQAYAQAYASK